MCGRYAFFSPAEAVRRVFGALGPSMLPPPRYNIAPTQPVAAIRDDGTGRLEVVTLRWGLLPAWAKDPAMAARMINARSETVADKPAFRGAFRRRRCLLPADGWYEWQAGPRGKQPWFIGLASREPFGMAGLWERWVDPDGGEVVETCTILTTAAAAAIRPIHDRMPVVLPAAAHAAWLDAGTSADLLQGMLLPLDGSLLDARPVSRAVNDARHEGPDLVRPVDATTQR